jgi:very-short-patch-repair endonuclease
MKNCENCNIEHFGDYGAGRFCTAKCARSFSTKKDRKSINEKVSKTFSSKPDTSVTKICLNCSSNFKVEYNKRHQKSCSFRCASQHRWKDEVYRMKISSITSETAQRRHNEGQDFGWRTRKKFDCSYPESIAASVLEDLRVPYVKEYRVGKYFIDFAIIENKIAIEIDGQQHLQELRAKSDKKKDDLLIKLGWSIYRIKWPNDNLKQKIKEITDYHNLSWR